MQTQSIRAGQVLKSCKKEDADDDCNWMTRKNVPCAVTLRPAPSFTLRENESIHGAAPVYLG